MSSWNEQYTKACKEMGLAEEEYRLADEALARATARVRQAQKECARLFRDRINAINHPFERTEQT